MLKDVVADTMLAQSKCMNIVVSMERAYVTDLGLGFVYMTDLKTERTKKVKTEKPIGISTDHSGKDR